MVTCLLVHRCLLQTSSRHHRIVRLAVDCLTTTDHHRRRRRYQWTCSICRFLQATRAHFHHCCQCRHCQTTLQVRCQYTTCWLTTPWCPLAIYRRCWEVCLHQTRRRSSHWWMLLDRRCQTSACSVRLMTKQLATWQQEWKDDGCHVTRQRHLAAWWRAPLRARRHRGWSAAPVTTSTVTTRVIMKLQLLSCLTSLVRHNHLLLLLLLTLLNNAVNRIQRGTIFATTRHVFWATPKIHRGPP